MVRQWKLWWGMGKTISGYRAQDCRARGARAVMVRGGA